jgi:hypothetical protein
MGERRMCNTNLEIARKLYSYEGSTEYRDPDHTQTYAISPLPTTPPPLKTKSLSRSHKRFRLGTRSK